MKPHSFFVPANIFKILKQRNKTLIFLLIIMPNFDVSLMEKTKWL